MSEPATPIPPAFIPGRQSAVIVTADGEAETLTWDDARRRLGG